MIRVQREDFDVGAELEALARANHAVGGIASFVGLVRDKAGDTAVASMTLEHYPGMTEKMLGAIEQQARDRWPLAASLIIHRYGTLAPGDELPIPSDLDVLLHARLDGLSAAALETARVVAALADPAVRRSGAVVGATR